jgi:hypothetical protein
MKREGVKHLIKCRCILPTMKKMVDPPFHSFVVFSIIDENGTMVPKNATCNNCGVLHHVDEVCKSKILSESEGSESELTIDDVSIFLPDSVNSVLSSYNAQLADYEHIKFMIEENNIDGWVILSSELNEGRRSGKILKYKGGNKFEIEPFSRKEFFDDIAR